MRRKTTDKKMKIFGKFPPGGTSLLVLVMLCFTACDQPPTSHEFTFKTMGTVASCKLMLPHNLKPHEAEAMVQGAFFEVNTTLSTWLPDSEISRLSRASADSAFAVSELMAICLRKSQQLNTQSGGAFDPTAETLMRLWGFYRRKGQLPSAAAMDTALADLGRWRLEENPVRVIKEKPGTRFDLGGIAKGLAVDLAVARLRSAGLKNGLIDLGGNLYCLGGAEGRDHWRVGIRNPHNKDELFATVAISEASVATSGSYERFVIIDGHRYGHIMNPATGQPAEGLLSATVIASKGILADGLSTTLFVLGPDKALLFLKEYYPEVEAVLVFPGTGGKLDTVQATPGLKGRLDLLPGFEKKYELKFSR